MTAASLRVDRAAAAFCCLENGGWALWFVLENVALPRPLLLRGLSILCFGRGEGAWAASLVFMSRWKRKRQFFRPAGA